MSDLYEADFGYYNTCRHRDLSEWRFPCLECIMIPTFEGTCKPARWEACEDDLEY